MQSPLRFSLCLAVPSLHMQETNAPQTPPPTNCQQRASPQTLKCQSQGFPCWLYLNMGISGPANIGLSESGGLVSSTPDRYQNALALPLHVRHQIGMLHLNIRLVCVVQVKVKPAKNCSDSKVELRHGEAIQSAHTSFHEMGDLLDSKTLPRSFPKRNEIPH